MNRNVSEFLIDRLVCAKYLYIKGREELDSESSYASGIAVLHFQDSAELILRVIAEHFHVSLKETEAFNRIIDLIDAKAEENGKKKLTHRSNLNQLNKTRVNFKHFAIRPELEDVKKFSLQLAEFYPIALKNFLNLDYENLSIVNLVKHTRTRNWLENAERYLNEYQYAESSACSRVAFEIYRKFNPNRSLWNGDMRHSIRRDFNIREISSRDILTVAEKIDTRLQKIKEHVDILFDGINPASYKKFIVHTPDVGLNVQNDVLRPDFDDDGKINEWYVEQFPEFTSGIANFCFRFSLDTILNLQEQALPLEYQRSPTKRNCRVKNDAKVFVSPSKKELLKIVEKDTYLHSFEPPRITIPDDMVAIRVENMTAFISKESVEIIDEENG